MDIFQIHSQIVADYKSYIRSFINIKDTAIRNAVETELEKGRLWPEPLIQFNPAFEIFGGVVEVAKQEKLCSEFNDIFKGFRVCHHAPTMIWTFNEARARGYAVDEQSRSEITTWAFGDMKTNSLTEQAPPRNVINLGWVYVLLSMEAAPEFQQARSLERPPAATTGILDGTNADAILSARRTLIHQIVSKQATDGSWGQPLDERVPLGGPVEDIVILSRLALLQSGDSSQAVTDSMRKAAEWLAANRVKTSRQGRNLRLLMDVCEGKRANDMNSAVASVSAEQNSDGGWSQTPDMPSDAYATGQTLYVLARAGCTPEDPHMQRGVDFLTRSQRADGSWPMISRVHAKNLDPITAAGTGWAVLGLLRGSPARASASGP